LGNELEGNEWVVEARNILSESGLEGDKEGDVVETSVDGLVEGEAF
jgi:hypothetical protein